MIGKDLKEYPATHSMETSWFFADVDGNIAFFDFEANGPVPTEVHCESDIESLVLDDFAVTDESGLSHFPLNKEQKELVMAFLELPKEEDIINCIVQIDMEKENEFLAFFPNKGNENNLVCLSKEDGLYAVNYLDEEQFARLWKSKIIVKTVPWDLFFPHCWEEDCLSGGQVCPFYFFQGDYDISELAKQMIAPSHPYRLSQMPPHLQAKVLRLPLKFSECEKLQIAEFFPFCGGQYDFDNFFGFELHYLPATSGGFWYFSSELIPSICECEENVGFYPHCSSLEPTILYVGANTRPYYFDEMIDKVGPFLRQNYVAVSTDIKTMVPSPLIQLKKKGIPIPDSVTECVSDKFGYWEQIFDYVNPRAVILFEDALPQLRKWESETGEFVLDEKSIRINGNEYPIFLWNGIEHNVNEIRHLAELPYRGRKRCVLAKEEYLEWEKLDEQCKQ